MKKLLALLLALMMASTGLSALADSPVDALGFALGALAGALYGRVSGTAGPADTPDQPAPDGQTPREAADPSGWRTMADVLALDTDGSEATWNDQSYIYIIDYAGTQWLIRAEFSRALSDAIRDVDFMADDRQAQVNAILAPCKIDLVIDLSTLALSPEALAAWIGKTGQDMLDAGWEYNGYSRDESGVRVNMVDGDFQYKVSFAEALEMSQAFGEMPGNLGEATVSDIVFGGKSYHFNEMDYCAPEPAPPAGLAGGWSPSEDPTVTDDLRALFDKALDGLTGVRYVPVACLGSQVVAGTNRAFLAQAWAVVPNAVPRYVMVYIYEDFGGNAEILNIADIDVGALCTYGADRSRASPS